MASAPGDRRFPEQHKIKGVADDYVKTLRGHLAQLDHRVAAEIRPDSSGGATVTAIASAAATAHDPLAAFLIAHRAVATTGARPVSAAIPDDASLPGQVCEQLRLTPTGPTPAQAGSIIVTGEVDLVDRCTPMALEDDGDLIYWLGPQPVLDISAEDVIDELLIRERKVAEVLVAASRDGLLNAALDVQHGGMATTIAAMAMLNGVGGRFWTPEQMDVRTALFDGALGGVICIVPRTEELRFSDMCIARYLPVHRVGVVDGTDVQAQDHFVVPIADLIVDTK